MQNEPLISVIVPVYKVEPYLDRCVQSIVNQTYKNLEIILVDDGSPDNCPAMCDAWAEKDSRVRVIHKKNGGAASARNAALDVMQGEYIAFTDSDDYIDANMFSALYASIERNNSDISMCELHNVDLNGAILDSPKLQCEHVKGESRDALVCLVEMSSICYCVLYNKLYKRFLWKDVRFPEYRIYEDEAVLAKIYALAKTVSYVYRSLYYYVQSENSIMRSCVDRRNLVVLDIMDMRRSLFEEMQDDDLVARNELCTIRITKKLYMQCRMQKNALQKPFLAAFRKQILTNFRLLFDRQYISSKLAMNIVLFALVPRLYTEIFQAVFSENND